MIYNGEYGTREMQTDKIQDDRKAFRLKWQEKIMTPIVSGEETQEQQHQLSI